MQAFITLIRCLDSNRCKRNVTTLIRSLTQLSERAQRAVYKGVKMVANSLLHCQKVQILVPRATRIWCETYPTSFSVRCQSVTKVNDHHWW